MRLVELTRDSSARGLVIKSAKPAGFCAGVNVDRVLSLQTADQAKQFLLGGLEVFDLLSSLSVPTVAVIHGVCLGAGLELALACRRRVALASAAPIQLGTPEVHFGLIPGWGAITRLPHLAGPEEGLNLLVTGRAIGYLLARSLGIVDKLAAAGDSLETPDLLPPEPVNPPEWSRDQWEDAWNKARSLIDEEPGEHDDVKLEILTIVAIELAHGVKAARDATVNALAEMMTSDAARDYLSALAARPESERHG